jgi:DNA repair MmcB-like protein
MRSPLWKICSGAVDGGKSARTFSVLSFETQRVRIVAETRDNGESKRRTARRARGRKRRQGEMKRSKVKQRGAPALLRLLEARHSKDLFVPECKDGPTHLTTHLRMDGWAMVKSWANPCVLAYEIKVSRSDFVADNKWPGYLPYCNQFYFVMPKDLIDLSEVPEQVGLLVAIGQGAGARLITKKKAPYRDVVIPESVYRYILMCRVRVESESDRSESDRDRWRHWLTLKAEDQKLGYQVAKRIRERATELEIENHRLTKQMENYDRVKVALKRLGYNPENPYGAWDLERRITEQRSVFDSGLIRQMTEARDRLTLALDKVREVEATQLPQAVGE